MPKALSLDLRQRTLFSVQEEDLMHREAVARFKVSAASVSRWWSLAAEGAVPMQGPLGGERRGHVVEAQAKTVLDVFHARRDMTLLELRAAPAERGLHFGYGKILRFFATHWMARGSASKSLTCSERGRSFRCFPNGPCRI